MGFCQKSGASYHGHSEGDLKLVELSIRDNGIGWILSSFVGAIQRVINHS